MCSSNPMIQSSGVNREMNSSRLWELKVMDDSKNEQWFLDTANWCTNELKETIAVCIAISHFQVWQAPSTDREMDMRSNPKEETIYNWYSQWANVVSLGISTTLLNPMPRSKWPTQTELTAFFFFWWLCFFSPLVFFFFLFFFCVCTFCFDLIIIFS